MALYWHPFLAELLRQDYGNHLIVEEEVALGDMPLRADLILIRRDPKVPLPAPFCFLGERTLVEYKSPDDPATQADLVTLEIYGLLYAQRQGITQRRDLTLWLLASHFRSNTAQRGGAYLAVSPHLSAGIRRGKVDGFPTFFMDLTRLPIQPEALPLLLVAKGPQERQLVEFLVDRCRDYPRHITFLRELHARLLLEVLYMKKLTPEQIGLDYRALLGLLGEERALDLIGEERVAEDLLRRKGVQWLRTIMERFAAHGEGVEPPASTPTPEA